MKSLSEFWEEEQLGYVHVPPEPEVRVFIIRQEGAEWVVRTHDGARVLGRHATREAAEAQLRAIEANKARALDEAVDAFHERRVR